MKQRRIYLVILFISLLGLTACDKKLSEDELKILEYRIPTQLYANSVLAMAEDVYKFLWDGIEQYSEEAYETVSKKVEKYEALNHLMGGSCFDVAELFGSSTSELYIRDYNRYIDYVNNHQEDLRDLIKEIVLCFSRDQTTKATMGFERLLDAKDTYGGDENNMIRVYFASEIPGLPPAIDREVFNYYTNLRFTSENMAAWGKGVMGDYTKPALSKEVVMMAMINMMKLIYSNPKPVYAIYDSEKKGWEVGYTSEEAVLVTFKQKGNVIDYNTEVIEYNASLIKSSSNVLYK